MKQFVICLALLILAGCSNQNNNKNMGLLDRFKKEKIEKSSKLMDEHQFWSIIESAKTSNNDLDAFAASLIKRLKKLSAVEIIGFQLREEQLRFDSYKPDLWCAGYIMNGGCSDDSFEYFRCWVIAQGKDVYYSSLKNPDSLVDLYSSEVDEYDFEDLMYVASDAFEQRTGKDIGDFVDYDNVEKTGAVYPKIDFTWEEEDEESMRKICPKLMAVAWK